MLYFLCCSGTANPLIIRLYPHCIFAKRELEGNELFCKNTLGERLQKHRKCGCRSFAVFKNQITSRGCRIFENRQVPQALCTSAFTPIYFFAFDVSVKTRLFAKIPIGVKLQFRHVSDVDFSTDFLRSTIDLPLRAPRQHEIAVSDGCTLGYFHPSHKNPGLIAQYKKRSKSYDIIRC